MSNRPSIQDIAEDPGRLKALPLDVLAMLIEDAIQASKLATAVKGVINTEIERRFEPAIATAYKVAGKDTGAIHIDADGFDLEVTRAKRVEWDQAELAVAVEKIRAAGDDPTEFVDISYAVPERKYVAWPSSIRGLFEPARTVKSGPTTLKLKVAA